MNDGAGALVVTSEDFARKRGLEVLATIVSQAYVADDFAYLARTPAKAGAAALAKAGKKIGDVERVELERGFLVGGAQLGRGCSTSTPRR